MTRKLFLLLTSICTLLIISFTGVTLAYFTDQSHLINATKVGQNISSIKETFPTPQPIIPEQEQTYKKVVAVTNSDSVPCYIRVSVAFSNEEIGQAVSFLNLNQADWIYMENSDKASLNGYYYYKHPVLPGETTHPLFDGIKVADNLTVSDVDINTTFQVIVYEESLQCSPYTTYQDAWNSFLRE